MVEEYSKLLILAYFEQYKEKYILSDLVKILGTNYKRLDIILQELKAELLLEYENGVLRLTEKGQRLLINQDMNNYSYKDEEYLEFKIDKSKAWDLSRPYVPEKFLTKI